MLKVLFIEQAAALRKVRAGEVIDENQSFSLGMRRAVRQAEQERGCKQHDKLSHCLSKISIVSSLMRWLYDVSREACLGLHSQTAIRIGCPERQARRLIAGVESERPAIEQRAYAAERKLSKLMIWL